MSEQTRIETREFDTRFGCVDLINFLTDLVIRDRQFQAAPVDGVWTVSYPVPLENQPQSEPGVA